MGNVTAHDKEKAQEEVNPRADPAVAQQKPGAVEGVTELSLPGEETRKESSINCNVN